MRTRPLGSESVSRYTSWVPMVRPLTLQLRLMLLLVALALRLMEPLAAELLDELATELDEEATDELDELLPPLHTDVVSCAPFLPTPA